MNVKDMINESDELRVVAKAVLMEPCKPEDEINWIRKYFALLQYLKKGIVTNSDLMLEFNVEKIDKRNYIDVYGYSYKDIKKGEHIAYDISHLDNNRYVSLYVADYAIQRYGVETIAAAALNEYGWVGYVKKPKRIPAVHLKEVLNIMNELRAEKFMPRLPDFLYSYYCRKQFESYVEGKEIPQWRPCEG